MPEELKSFIISCGVIALRKSNLHSRARTLHLRGKADLWMLRFLDHRVEFVRDQGTCKLYVPYHGTRTIRASLHLWDRKSLNRCDMVCTHRASFLWKLKNLPSGEV